MRFAQILCAIAPAFSVIAEDQAKEFIYAPYIDLRELLELYEAKSKRPVYLALNVPALRVTINGENLTKTELLEFIRKTLLEKYGIELRETPDGVTLARKIADPKPLSKEEKEEIQKWLDRPKTRVRQIEPRPAPVLRP